MTSTTTDQEAIEKMESCRTHIPIIDAIIEELGYETLVFEDYNTKELLPRWYLSFAWLVKAKNVIFFIQATDKSARLSVDAYRITDYNFHTSRGDNIVLQEGAKLIRFTDWVTPSEPKSLKTIFRSIDNLVKP